MLPANKSIARGGEGTFRVIVPIVTPFTVATEIVLFRATGVR
jgi:hypothetical protein